MLPCDSTYQQPQAFPQQPVRRTTYASVSPYLFSQQPNHYAQEPVNYSQDQSLTHWSESLPPDLSYPPQCMGPSQTPPARPMSHDHGMMAESGYQAYQHGTIGGISYNIPPFGQMHAHQFSNHSQGRDLETTRSLVLRPASANQFALAPIQGTSAPPNTSLIYSGRGYDSRPFE